MSTIKGKFPCNQYKTDTIGSVSFCNFDRTTTTINNNLTTRLYPLTILHHATNWRRRQDGRGDDDGGGTICSGGWKRELRSTRKTGNDRGTGRKTEPTRELNNNNNYEFNTSTNGGKTIPTEEGDEEKKTLERLLAEIPARELIALLTQGKREGRGEQKDGPMSPQDICNAAVAHALVNVAPTRVDNQGDHSTTQIGSGGRKSGIALSRGSTEIETLPSGGWESNTTRRENRSHAKATVRYTTKRARDGSERVDVEIPDEDSEDEKEEEEKEQHWKRVGKKNNKGKEIIPPVKEKKNNQEKREEGRGNGKRSQTPSTPSIHRRRKGQDDGNPMVGFVPGHG